MCTSLWISFFGLSRSLDSRLEGPESSLRGDLCSGVQVPLEQLPHLPNVRGQPGMHLLEVLVLRGCQKAGRLRAVREVCLEEVAPRTEIRFKSILEWWEARALFSSISAGCHKRNQRSQAASPAEEPKHLLPGS